MKFIPGSHLGPLLPHAPRSAGAYALQAKLPEDDALPVTCPLSVGGSDDSSSQDPSLLFWPQQHQRRPSCLDHADRVQGLAALGSSAQIELTLTA